MNTPVVVTLGEACDTTVVRESETTVVQRVVETQLVVAPGCGSVSGGSGGGGVSSYNALTDVPTEFPPSAHGHTIANVTGLAPRILAVGGTYTYDCDPLNADNGITDPYKFITLAAMFNAVLLLMAKLPFNSTNQINMLLADGTYAFVDLHNFMTYGAPVGRSWGYDGLPANALCRFEIASKNAPTAIADNAWSAITSDATEAAQRTSFRIANATLIKNAFKVKFTNNGSDWYYIKVPGNCRLNGVAILDEKHSSTTYFAAGFAGANGYALHGLFGNSYVPDYNEINVAFSMFRTHANNVNIIVSHCSAMRVGELVSENYTTNSVWLKIINPKVAAYVASPSNGQQYPYFAFGFTCIGNLEFKLQGWLGMQLSMTPQITFAAGCVGKAGEVTVTILQGIEMGALSCSISSQAATVSWNIQSFLFAPIYLTAYDYPAFVTKFPNRIGAFVQGDLGYGSYTPLISTFGVGSPNTIVLGNVGDKYTNTSGGVNTTEWIKESGISTKTGWVPVLTALPTHVHAISDVIGLAPNAYPFTQSSASATWTINHNLNFYPNVETRSVGGKEMLGEVLHTSTNQVIIYFDSAFAGTATCS